MQCSNWATAVDAMVEYVHRLAAAAIERVLPWSATFCCCSKSEVMNLLESAGFSRANPYYVVQQGKVWGALTPSGQLANEEAASILLLLQALVLHIQPCACMASQ